MQDILRESFNICSCRQMVSDDSIWRYIFAKVLLPKINIGEVSTSFAWKVCARLQAEGAVEME